MTFVSFPTHVAPLKQKLEHALLRAVLGRLGEDAGTHLPSTPKF